MSTATEVAVDSELEVEDREQEEREQGEREQGDKKGLAALVADLEGYDLGSSDPLAMPGPAEVARAVFFDLRRIEMRLAAVREALQAMDFIFDWGDDDLAVERDGGLDALGVAGDTIEDFRDAIKTWLWQFNSSRVVVLDPVAMDVVRELAASTPYHRGVVARLVVYGALLHLAGEPDADAIVAAAQRERVTEEAKETGFMFPKAKEFWPWVRRDGRPWDSDRGGVPDTDGKQAALEPAGPTEDSSAPRGAQDHAEPGEPGEDDPVSPADREDAADSDGAPRLRSYPGTVGIQLWDDDNSGDCLWHVPAVVEDGDELMALAAGVTELAASSAMRRARRLQGEAESLRHSVAGESDDQE